MENNSESDVVVIKVGGAAGNDLAGVASDVAELWRAGRRVVLVHGGSGEATRLGEALGRPPLFATSPNGHRSRLTDPETLEVFLMATALVNRRLVAALRAAGAPAIGLSGLDGGLIEAERKEAFRVVEEGRVRVVRDDLSGRPVAANADLLRLLLGAGFLPVIAPVGATTAGQALNIDGDRAAACVAAALDAEALLLLTAVPGLLRNVSDPTSLVPVVELAGLAEALALADGAMKKKVLAAGDGVRAGIARVVIASSVGVGAVEAALAGGGTAFVRTGVLQ